MSNPLQKYFRQPKLFISLPSKGLFYKEGSLQGDAGNFPIFAMTGMDEIIMKTPDALFSGEATISLVESCCPFITDAHSVPSLDVDAILTAIRIATFGENMTVEHTCRNCKSNNEFDVNLTKVLEHYENKTFKNTLMVDDLSLTLRPLSYQEMTMFNIENFKLQKMLNQLVGESVTDEQRQTHLDGIYKKLAEIQADVFTASIEAIQTPEEAVTDKQHIKEWILNSVKTSYQLIKNRLEENRTEWALPEHSIKCNECGHEDTIEVSMDQSSFFD